MTLLKHDHTIPAVDDDPDFERIRQTVTLADPGNLDARVYLVEDAQGKFSLPIGDHVGSLITMAQETREGLAELVVQMKIMNVHLAAITGSPISADDIL